jgi:hypothetical protein
MQQLAVGVQAQFQGINGRQNPRFEFNVIREMDARELTDEVNEMDRRASENRKKL